MSMEEVRRENVDAYATSGIGFFRRLRIAGSGLCSALREDSGVRSQIIGTVAMLVTLIAAHPAAHWWAIAIFASLSTLALELVNTALERTMDLIHRDYHPVVKQVKDIAAAAVVVSSLGVLTVGLLMIRSVL